MKPEDQPVEKREERNAFLFLTIFFVPMISVALVGGYGLLIWLYQIIAGPPGPPGS